MGPFTEPQPQPLQPEGAVLKTEELSVQTPVVCNAGDFVSIRKIDTHGASQVFTGTILEGTLRNDLRVGSPVYFEEGGNTTTVVEITEAQGATYITTRTSVYELRRGEKPALQETHEGTVSGTLAAIERDLNLQSQSVQEILKNIKEHFCQIAEVQGKKYLFTSICKGFVIGLVQDQANPSIWKTRAFRFSGSDHQWKSLPGLRANGKYLKGDEDNPLHHYVQSAKLHPDMYLALMALPSASEKFDALEFLPMVASERDPGRYTDELQFTESYQKLKDPQWGGFQGWTQSFYKAYDFLVTQGYNRAGFGPDSRFYTVIASSSAPEMILLKNALDRAHLDPEVAGWAQKGRMSMMERSSLPTVQELALAYRDCIGTYIVRSFETDPPSSMTPDFSLANRLRAYEKSDHNDTSGTHAIYVEEFQVSSPAGDTLIFAMAYDTKGRVYIDNIYDPRVACTDYGTFADITQMGHLVYKPEDYSQQTYGIPEEYLDLKDTEIGYIDISKLWLRIPLIQKYKEALIQRGVLTT